MNKNHVDDIILRLNGIYERIPSIECKHCHACSGPIFWFYPEELNIRQYLMKMNYPYLTWSQEEFEKNGMKCPYLQNERCKIYPVRPMVCRLQGIIEELPCAFFPTPLLSADDVLNIKQEMNQLINELSSLHKLYGTRRGSDSVKNG